jgi:hypothetical protein
MPVSQWNLEFLNHNAQRSYPLTADSTKKDVTGSFTIPPDFLVGLDIPISPAMDMQTGRFFIRQLGSFSSGIQLIFAYDTGTEIYDVASALIPTNTEIRNKVFAMGGIEPYDDIVGKIVIGQVATIQLQPRGLFNFELDDTRIEPQAIRPMIRALSSLRIATASGSVSDRIYGDVELVAGTNIQLATVINGNEAKIVISALRGEGTIETCACEGDAAEIPCIKTINGIRPTPEGDFNFVGDNCLTFSETENGLKVTDSCCQPCCGCPELEAITRQLELFATQRAGLEVFVNQLAATNATFSTTILGAKLGDRPCTSCGG